MGPATARPAGPSPASMQHVSSNVYNSSLCYSLHEIPPYMHGKKVCP